MGARLTRREVQCVRLAGEGLANKEIARRLGPSISPRTVNNHLSNAYAKLGTSDRFEAAALVARDYPDFSRIGPIPMSPAAGSGVDDGAPGDTSRAAGGPGAASSSWILPRPPRGMARLVLILVFAAAAAVVVSGIVFMMTASLQLSADHAPANAVRSATETDVQGARQ